MKQKSGKLNYAFWVICILAIIRNITNIVKSITKLLTPESVEVMGKSIILSDHPASAFYLVSSVFIIITIVLTLNKRKIGVWGFFVVQFISAVASLGFVDNPLSQMPISFGIALMHSTVFFCLLLIKRNGVSSLKVIFNDEKDNVTLNISNDSESKGNIPSTQKSIDKQEMAIQVEKEERIDNELIQNKEVDKSQHNESQDLIQHSASKKAKIVFVPQKMFKVGMCIILSLILISGVSYGIWLAYNNSKPSEQYIKANKLFSEGKIEEAISIYSKLMKKNNYIPAKTKLGELYTMNDSVTPNYRLGIKYLTENAPLDSLALFDLMSIYNPESDLCEGKFRRRKK